MTTANPTLVDMQRTIGDTLRAHWRLYVFQGALMIVLGMLAVAAPAFATLTVDIYVGWLFLISGVLGLIAMFSARNVPGFLWTLITALLSIVVGGVLLWKPVEGAVSLTIVLTAFLSSKASFKPWPPSPTATRCRVHGAGCSPAASPISRSPQLSSRDGLEPRPGLWVCSSASIF